MALAEELEQIAAAALAHGPVAAVLAAEPAAGGRFYLVALGQDERSWLVLDGGRQPLDERVRVREVASLVAMAELAAELTGGPDEARIASPDFLDAVGSPELSASIGIVEAFVREVEERYALPLR